MKFQHKHTLEFQMLGLNFINTGLISKDLGKFYSDIFDKRQTGDYDDFIEMTQIDVMSLIDPAKELIQNIEKLLKQKNNDYYIPQFTLL